MAGDLKTSVIIDLVDRVTGPARRVSQALAGIRNAAGGGRVSGALGQVGSQLGQVQQSISSVSRGLAGLGLGAGAVGWAIKRHLIDVAAEFEKFGVILETTEGSADKAKKSLDWVSNFAAKTPYELGEVMNAFVMLRTYGLDPTNGLLRTLGDTSAAMGKPLTQAVEAIADAITGENERLKEFGIRARVSGNRVAYEYTVAGKQVRKMADINSRAMIESTLSAIWNEKFGGAMLKMSGTWGGLMSNLADQWTRFRLLIMQSGAFDWLKIRLSTLLATIDRMASNGDLQRIANLWGQEIVGGLREAWAAFRALLPIIVGIGRGINWLSHAVGGWRNLMLGITVLIGAKVIVALGGLTLAFLQLGAAILTTPIGWLALALAGAAILIYRYWSPLSDFFAALWDKIKRVVDLARGVAGNLHLGAAGATALAPPARTVTGSRTQQVGGTIHIRVDGEGRPRVKQVRATGPVDLTVDTGLAMGGW
ncbi:MAG: tape measure protein [Nitrospirota bacterium]|nr:tape measure protein [Nitrospirota bacterium]